MRIKTHMRPPNRSPEPSLSRRVLSPVLALVALASPAFADGPLQAKLETLINRASLGNARVGVRVTDTANDRALAEIRDDEQYLPASNMKLLTTGVALRALGPDFTFRTELRVENDRVVLVGDGDPAFADPMFLERLEPAVSVDEFFDLLGREVAGRTAGRRLRSVVVDDRVFDREWVPASWPVEQLNMTYAAEVGGVNVHTNVLAVFPEPSNDLNAAPALTLQPATPWVTMVNRAQTVAKGQHTAWIARPLPKNEFTVFGNVPRTSPVPVRVALHNPPLTAGQLLAQSSARAGARFENLSTPRAHEAARLVQIDEAVSEGELAAAVVTPLYDVVAHCNRVSQNMFAEALLKRSGHEFTGEPGSWTNGAAVTRMVVRELLGPAEAAEIQIGDGSGLSRGNGVSPRFFTSWLGAVARDPDVGGLYFASLPAPSEDETTLRNRFRGRELSTEIRAKSGSIDGVRCLSGYARHPGTGRLLAFSILINDLPRANGRAALDLHEAVVDAIDDWLVEQEGPVRAMNATLGG